MFLLDIYVGMKVVCIVDFCGVKIIVDLYLNIVCKNFKYICNYIVREIDFIVELKFLMDYLINRMLIEINVYSSCCYLKFVFVKF